MKLTFFTPPQCMAFVDPVTHQLTNAGELQPGVIYDVFAVVKNEDAVEYPNVQINVVHSAFGIGIPGGTSFIVQPAPIDVPPALNASQPGLATFQFRFMAPPAGHGCLTATIILTNAKLNQNLTVVTAPQGVASTISFLVFSDANVDETMLLQLEQRLENGTPVTAADHWQHNWVVPPILTPSNQTPDSVTLHLPRGATYYSIGINITVPATATVPHIFFVRGTVNGVDKGSVSLMVKPDHTFVKPAPYVIGGFESSDIVLIDPQGHVVPIIPGPMDTMLRPNTDYSMRAVIHNSSPTPAVNTLVRFWELPGGLNSLGQLLDIQTVTVPPTGFVVVTSRNKFHSGVTGSHSCGVITVYNPQSDTCNVDFPTVSSISAWPAFMHDGTPGPMAWRNTDAMIAFFGEKFHLDLVAMRPKRPLPEKVLPIDFDIEVVHVPRDWEKVPEVVDATRILNAAGAQTGYPAFLLPKIRDQFKKLDLEIEVEAKGVPVEALETVAVGAKAGGRTAALAPAPLRQFKLHDTGDKPVSISITGKLPANVHDGDTVLLRCSARYPTAEGTAGPRIQFTEALHVIKH
ncbi:MAG TPA: hypothetical protein VFW31_15665 [Candidatus Angelobacter sp.]|nr:hypothetical protein [Candidatus Angelobacter sp.]